MSFKIYKRKEKNRKEEKGRGEGSGYDKCTLIGLTVLSYLW